MATGPVSLLFSEGGIVRRVVIAGAGTLLGCERAPALTPLEAEPSENPQPANGLMFHPPAGWRKTGV